MGRAPRRDEGLGPRRDASADRGRGRDLREPRGRRGNVDAASAVWRLEPLDEARTEVTIELFLDPKFSLPATLINRGIVSGAADVVRAFRDRVEGR